MMKHILAFLLGVSCLLYSPIIYAKNYSSAAIERYVTKTPRETEDKLNALVAYLIKPFDNDYDKAKAIAFWIASRISYDEYLYNNASATKLIKTYHGQKPNELLRSRVGICGDFAELFETMCHKAKISAYSVTGHVYQSNQSVTTKVRRNSGHVWNYFIYKGEKIYVDTTFMANGRTGVKGTANTMNHQRALRNIQKENRYESQTNTFDEFYFDFSYKTEKQKRGYIRKEK